LRIIRTELCNNRFEMPRIRLEGCFNRHALPLFAFALGLLEVELHDGAFAQERSNRGGAKLRRLLDDQVHVFPFGDGLGQRHFAFERRHLGMLQEPQLDSVPLQADNLRGRFVTLPIENDHPFSGLHAHDVAAMMRFLALEPEPIELPDLRRNIKTRRGHGT
jgi:hypothetical protein